MSKNRRKKIIFLSALKKPPKKTAGSGSEIQWYKVRGSGSVSKPSRLEQRVAPASIYVPLAISKPLKITGVAVCTLYVNYRKSKWHICHTKVIIATVLFLDRFPVLQIRIRDSVHLTPGSGIRNMFLTDPGSQSHIFESWVTFIWVKIQ